MLTKLTFFFQSQKKIASIIVLFLMVVAVPLTVFVAQKQQNIKQKAAEIQRNETNEIDILTNQLLQTTTVRTVTAEDKKKNEQQLVDIAKKRKELLLQKIKENPQEFLDKATLADKRNTFTDEVKGYIEQNIETDGTLTIIHTDNFEEKKSTFEYYLKEKGGNNDLLKNQFKNKLYFVKEPTGVTPNSTVKLRGIRIDNNIALNAIRNTTTNYNMQVIAQATLPPTLREQKLVVVLFNFSDDPKEPTTVNYIKSNLLENQSGSEVVDTFYKKSSFNKISFSGDAFGWYTIPLTKGTTCDFGTLYQLGIQVAQTKGVNFSNYDRYVFAFTDGHGCVSPRIGGLGGIGGNPSYSFIFYPTSMYIYAHELGHNFGVHHANLLSCGNQTLSQSCFNEEYGDSSSIMGITTDLLEFNGPEKVAVGWINDQNIKDVNVNGTYTISKIESQGTLPQIIKIRKSDTNENYYLSYKTQSRVPSGFLKGASLHIWNNDNFTQTLLLNLHPGTQDYGFSDGATFYDNVNRITIKQVDHDQNSANISINFGVEPPTSTPSPTPFASQDGLIIFSSIGKLYSIHPDGRGITLLADKGNSVIQSSTISRDGRKIAYTTGDNKILVIDNHGNLIKQINSTPVTNNLLFNTDGKKIFFYGKNGTEKGIYIIDIDTNSIQRIIENTSADYNSNPLDVSPNGEKLVFTNTNNSNLFIADITGNNQQQLANTFVTDAAFSANGNNIFYSTSRQSGRELLQLNLSTNAVTPFTFPGNFSFNSSVAFSPNGQQLAVRDSNSHIHTINLDGSNLQKVTDIAYVAVGPRYWGPDPDFVNPTPTPTNTPTPSPTITPTPAPLCNVCSADVSRDGRVSSLDYSVMATCFDKEPTGICANADINKTGVVDIEDYVCVVNNFGKICQR